MQEPEQRVGWRVRCHPRVTLAVVERVRGAGCGSHSLSQEKLGQRLFLKKPTEKRSFPFSFLVGGMWR